MEALLIKFLGAVLPSLVSGAAEFIAGKSMDDALARTIESLETKRAQAKFENLQVKP